MTIRLTYDKAPGLAPAVEHALDTLTASLQAQFNSLHQTFPGALTVQQPRCHLVKTASQAITTGTNTDLTWPVIGQENPDGAQLETQYDNGARFGGTFLKVAGSTAIVPPLAGFYLVIATIVWDTNATGTRRVRIRSDFGGSAVTYGSGAVEQPGGHSAAANTIQQVSAVIKVRDVNQTGLRDAIYVQVAQTSGGNLNVLADSHVQLLKIS